MKPKTKLQKQVTKMSVKLPELTEKQKLWAMEHAVEHLALRTKKAIICTECGEKYPDVNKLKDSEIEICPNCGSHLIVESTRRQKDRKIDYFSIITTMKGFQVIRYFFIEKSSKAGEKAHYFIDEILQRWLLPNGQFVTRAKLKVPFSYYCYDVWNHSSDLEIRVRDNPDYYICDEAIYPIRKYIAILKRNGFKKRIKGVSLFNLFKVLITDPHAETLLKAGQIEALSYMAKGYENEIDRLWPSIKICMRRNYRIKDFSIWKDYCHLLDYFKMDMRNAKHVCPDNLFEAHDYLERKKHKILQKERETWMRELEIRKKLNEIERKKREEKAAVQYVQDRSKFLDLVFKDDLLEIKVLQNMQDFIEEGRVMHHCVYTNEYYLNKDSLLLSARIKNERIATIELSLNNFSIVQCRGKYNMVTPYDEKITKLIKQNIGLIKQKMTA